MATDAERREKLSYARDYNDEAAALRAAKALGEDWVVAEDTGAYWPLHFVVLKYADVEWLENWAPEDENEEGSWLLVDENGERYL